MKTLVQLIAARGIDEAREIQLMKKRARHHLTKDRTKVFASTPLANIPVFGRHPSGRSLTVHDINADLLTLKLARENPAHDICPGIPPSDVTTRDYVAAWCRLNHLTF